MADIEAATDDGVNWAAVRQIVDEGKQEGGAEPGTGSPGEPPFRTPGQDLAAFLVGLAQVIRPALPNVAAIYTPDTCASIGASLDPLCAKYGWMQNGFALGPELNAAIVVVPIVIATAMAAKHDVGALKAAKAAAEAAKADKAREAASAAPSTIQ